MNSQPAAAGVVVGMAMTFTVLGAVDARLDGRPLDLGHARQRCVLAALLVEPGKPVAADVLLFRVWGIAFRSALIPPCTATCLGCERFSPPAASASTAGQVATCSRSHPRRPRADLG